MMHVDNTVARIRFRGFRAAGRQMDYVNTPAGDSLTRTRTAATVITDVAASSSIWSASSRPRSTARLRCFRITFNLGRACAMSGSAPLRDLLRFPIPAREYQSLRAIHESVRYDNRDTRGMKLSRVLFRVAFSRTFFHTIGRRQREQRRLVAPLSSAPFPPSAPLRLNCRLLPSFAPPTAANFTAVAAR